ncbi:class I adenylate-forming enzyme family protein [Mycolicibacterium thermoresistibile]
MTGYEQAPWLSQYPSGTPAVIRPPVSTMVELFDDAVTHNPTGMAVRYFDVALSYADLDEAAEAFAVALQQSGVGTGDRVALFLQNDPSFVIGLIGIWKVGAIAVTVNPMNKVRELAGLLDDSGTVALLCLSSLYHSVVAEAVAASPGVHTVITTSGTDLGAPIEDDAPESAAGERTPSRLVDLIEQYRERRVPRRNPAVGDPAVLVYTSGTTGQPKAAIITHRGFSFNSYTYREWMGLRSDDVVLGIAPLFHITGLVGHIGAALACRGALVLTDRFAPDIVLQAMRTHRPTFTIAAITALRSLLSASTDPRADFASLRAVYSGGAPVAPAFADDFRRRTGVAIHNIYGLTETTSPSHGTPLGVSAPVDPQTGALSVGVPVFNTMSRVLDDDGEPVPVGQPGEIVISGPQVIEAYWNRPEQTAEAIVDGELRTGDIGYMNDDGWFFIIDRKKDMINASGYKVWPREIEDFLYGHPAVLEAAVVGVPDPYRGETVKAYVALKQTDVCRAEDLIEFCKAGMAAYKYPREIEIVDELPKTLTGKILRRSLRR